MEERRERYRGSLQSARDIVTIPAMFSSDPTAMSVNMSQDKAPRQLPLSPSHMQPWLSELRKPGVTGHESFAHVLWRFERSWLSGAVAEFPEQTRKAIWGRHENSAN